MKTCSRCNLQKNVDEFTANQRTSDGLQPHCRSCRRAISKKYRQAHPDKVLARKQKWSKENKVKIRDYQLLRNYGINSTDREVIEKNQNCLCGICNSKLKLHVDHDHKTGKVRGLLCHSCNTAIGLLKEDISVLESAIKYLMRM